MKIEWDEPQVPKRNADSLWTKVRNSLSVVRQTHDGPPPHSPRERRNSYSYSPSPSRGSTSRSSSRPPSSSHQRSRSSGPSPTYARHIATSPSGRPIVTIQTNGGPPQVIRGSSGQYGATTYVVQSPKIYDPYASSPRITPMSSPVPGSRPVAVHRSSVPLSSSPLRTPASPRAGTPRRSNTAPVSAGGTNGGVMYNGKLIVGDPDEVQRYISSQKTIEKWLQNVG